MLTKIRTWLRDRLFSTEQLELQARLLALEKLKESASVVALAREQLKSFDPQRITLYTARNGNQLTAFDGLDSDEQAAMLEQMHQLHENRALWLLIDFLVGQQVIYGQMEAESLLQLNFSRGTVNGLSLLRDEVNTYEGVYQQQLAAAKEPKFAPHEVI